MSPEMGWHTLPEELQLQVLSYLDPASLLCFATIDTSNRLLAQDDRLCEEVCRGYYPLAAARKSYQTSLAKAQEPFRVMDPWYKHLVNTSVLRQCIVRRKSLDYYELATGTELPPRYSQNLGATPRGRHHSKFNFGRLALFFTGVDVFLIVDLATKNTTEYTVPDPFNIRDIYLEEEFVYVLTTRSSSQYIFRYDMQGNLTQTLDTRRDDLVLIMANRRHIVVYSADLQLWVPYRVETITAPPIEEQKYIRSTTLTSNTTIAVDEHYFYQLQESTSELFIYDLDNEYCVSRISLFPRQQHMRSEVISINRHCYVYGPGQIAFIDGLNMTKVNVPGIPHADDSPMWDSRLLVDLGGWIAWFGDAEEGVMFGTFCILPSETDTAEMLDCGRLRGPNEPEDQYECKSVSLQADEKWIICIMDSRVLVWQIQR